MEGPVATDVINPDLVALDERLACPEDFAAIAAASGTARDEMLARCKPLPCALQLGGLYNIGAYF
jgi:hypothetical protein